MSIRHIFIVDDHMLFRSGLASVLEGMPDIAMTEYASVEQALLAQLAPDLIMLDINLAGISGLEGIRLFRTRWPDVQIIMLSASESHIDMQNALLQGAVAYLNKSSSSDLITGTIQRVLDGDAAVTAAPASLLTPRQYDVLALLSKGMSNKMIGRELDLSESTVRWHVQSLLEILQTVHRSDAVHAARKQGLLS